MSEGIPFARAGYQRVAESEAVYVDWLKLSEFVAQVFMKLNMLEDEARVAADVLVQADLRGVDSHGVAHMVLDRFYVAGLLRGVVNPRPRMRIVRDLPATVLIDGDSGLGLVVGHHAMNEAIRRAQQVGAGFVSVYNTHHYGTASYFAMMALAHDMIGVSMTNGSPLTLPTFGAKPMLGSNPISIAVPAGGEPPFVLDMATSLVAAGKLEIASRLGLPIPKGWALDPEMKPTTEPTIGRAARRFLPLGGTREGGSHKGYGLAVAVDVFCGLLSSAGASAMLQQGFSGHFFGAFRVDGFRPIGEFKAMMDEMLAALKATPPAPGHERVYVAGEIEHEMALERRAKGIPLHRTVIAQLQDISKELGVPYTL
ncbi:MAG: Ldh family oxidoreductase [Chloroflexi bacterium]|nr:Ldh family oxidoreductase [Chloroflexota bacterium]